MATSTILDILTKGREEPDFSKMTAGSGGVEGRLHTNKVKDWKEFTYGNILLAFGEFLHHTVSTEDFLQRALSVNAKVPQIEDDTMDVLRDWTLIAVRDALEATAAEFPGHFPRTQDAIDFRRQHKIRNLDQNTTGNKDKENKTILKSDWGLFYIPGAEISCPNESDQGEYAAGQKKKPEDVLLVVGEAKKCSNWSFDDLINALERPEKTWSYKVKKRGSTSKPTPGNAKKEEARKPILRPTDQLGTYCVWSRTALGFLHTEKELVVCNTTRKQRS